MSEISISIETKSIGTLIDELITTNLKCFMEQETIMSGAHPRAVAEAATNAQLLNARRSQLIRAIDERFGEGSITQTAKTYE